MIEDQIIAQKISDLHLKTIGELNEILFEIQKKCSEEEFHAYRRIVGQLMATFWDALNAIYAKHPSIKPKQFEQFD
ncbi:hypothetical protein BGI05_00260 [Snodgrassella alvi]|uniref:hypothetical protein n=1 Tax=Snodgrassella alvi TaxID=1196083 RepID=UPI000A069936|nr:hypothetical protein [Snodgrassella alvi]ORF03747.1 hypothetical protein BGH97_02070 [Snodgrassella alvi]ORF07811.1 hypothetical protein BGH99_07250 [Snodgrassella alvi]ORF14928.1 hypothetical protein BGI00_01480 [Snodgrassella alvi]ORF16437.1 hypothetical protein BGI02_00385 [Snodgrassella alvi]ORF23314.1 hypothetical protein BGI05_00260 [Snodgrassella alvi]